MSLPIPTLTFNAVTVSVGGRHILENVTWHLYKSHHYLLTGANGSGKSTLLKTLWDHDLITNGHISYPGFDGMRPIRDQIGYVSDELVKHIQKRSIQQSEYTSYSGMLHEETTYTTLTRDTPCDYAYLHTLIQEWDLDALMERPAHHLSTGQLQICLIARALSKKPRLLILDEALEGLDESNRKRFNDVLVTASDHTQLICVAHHADDVLACLTDQLKIQAGVCICSPLIPQSTQATHIKKNISSPTPHLPKIASLVHVSVRHDDHIVLSDFSWDIHQGECWLLSGPNGAGKSTIVHLLTADHPQAHGQNIRIGPYSLANCASIWDIKAQISYITPTLTHRFHRPLSVYEVVASGMYDTIGLYTKLASAEHVKVISVMQQCSIDHLSEKPFLDLSKGQKQLVLIARAYAKKALLLILDEPTRGLDEYHRLRVLALIEKIGETGQTMIYVTHRADEIPRCITHYKYLEKLRS